MMMKHCQIVAIAIVVVVVQKKRESVRECVCALQALLRLCDVCISSYLSRCSRVYQ